MSGARSTVEGKKCKELVKKTETFRPNAGLFPEEQQQRSMSLKAMAYFRQVITPGQ